MREQCISILEKLKTQIEGDTFSSQVVDEYLKQESIERTEIQFTTKELKNMATVHYKENRLQPAYNNLRQALTISPKDKQIALSLMKVLLQMHSTQPLNDEQLEVVTLAARMLTNEKLSASQADKRDQYIDKLGLEVEAPHDKEALGVLGHPTA
jgi:hypothetical protein